VRYALIHATRDVRLNLGAFARESGTHPELVRRFVALGLLEAHQDPTGELWFSRSELAALGRVQRLRAGFALNYAAIGLVTELLDRIATLEAALRTARVGPAGPPVGTAGQPARRPGG
jgi:chaperone modulatory protein CbpM